MQSYPAQPPHQVSEQPHVVSRSLAMTSEARTAIACTVVSERWRVRI